MNHLLIRECLDSYLKDQHDLMEYHPDKVFRQLKHFLTDLESIKETATALLIKAEDETEELKQEQSKR